MTRIAIIADLTAAANMIAEEIALNMMDGIKAQWDWAAELSDVVAQLVANYADGFTVDLDLIAYCEWLVEAAV